MARYPIRTSELQYDQNEKTLTGDAIKVEYFMGANLIRIQSSKTGKIEEFKLTHTEPGADGYPAIWEYEPVNPLPHVKKAIFRIND